MLCVSPTGSGKTTVFAHLVSRLEAIRRPSLILVHRRELADQAARRLREFGVPFGFIMAGERPRRALVQIASVATLVNRELPPASLVIADEAHLSTAKTWLKVIQGYGNVPVVGFTATPWRLSGDPLSGLYDDLVVIASPRDLREQGFLCPYTGFSYKHPDTGELKITAGEYNERASAAAMSKSLIVDNIVDEWGKHARGLSTVVFAVTVEHSKQLTDRFLAAGVRAEHLDASTPLERRKQILKRVDDGTTQVLCNVGIAIEGIDIPRLKCCVLARPTKSLVKALQMQGRVRRPYENQVARIHDHAFVINEHGLPDDDRDYSLLEGSEPTAERLTSLRTCPECFAIYEGAVCPACGTFKTPDSREELNTVADAEQVAFSSDEPAPVKPPASRLPILIRWNRPGRVIEGTLIKRWVEAADYGPQPYFRLSTTDRDIDFPGPTHLTSLLKGVPIPDSKVRITYLRDMPLPGSRLKKIFKVEVDRGR